MKNEFINELYKNLFSRDSLLKIFLGVIILFIISFAYYIFNEIYIIDNEYLFFVLILAVVVISYIGIFFGNKIIYKTGYSSHPESARNHDVTGYLPKPTSSFHFFSTKMIITITIIIISFLMVMVFPTPFLMKSDTIPMVVSYLAMLVGVIIFIIFFLFFYYIKYYHPLKKKKKKKKKKKNT